MGMTPSGLDASFIRCPLILDGAIGAAVEDGTIIHKEGKRGSDLLETCRACGLHRAQSFIKLAGYATSQGTIHNGILIKSEAKPEPDSALRPVGEFGWTPTARTF